MVPLESSLTPSGYQGRLGTMKKFSEQVLMHEIQHWLYRSHHQLLRLPNHPPNTPRGTRKILRKTTQVYIQTRSRSKHIQDGTWKNLREPYTTYVYARTGHNLLRP